ncbi:polymorphic toxin type 50 domain-containing protein [Roseateles sp. YR242]|uniref:polymorphic toxin type 50 domain-containing protein n=1 Tax=Roseateles sp. YR242 TaxID=1855305 RepID=UPI001160D889
MGPTIPAHIAANRQAVSGLGIPNRLSPRQDLHVPPITDGRSVLTADPANLVQGLVNGNFTVLRTPKSGQAIVDFGQPIGGYWRTQNGVPTLVGPTNYGSVMFGKNGSHIVPAKPTQW